jgi:type II secretory pathway pseudopilin PulG
MRTHRPDAGFSLTALIFFAAAASIVIAAAVPAYQMQAKRERELELIFRGQEYARAIQKYQRKFGVFPTSVDQLVSTNNLRFLRRPYQDPITGKEFRLITIDPNGTVSGSKVFSQNTNAPSLFGNTPMFGNSPNGTPGNSNTSPSSATPGTNRTNSTTNPTSNSSFGSSGGFGNSSSGFGNSSSGFGNTSSGFGNSSSGFGNSSSGFGNSSNNSGFGSQPQSQPGTTPSAAGGFGSFGSNAAGNNRPGGAPGNSVGTPFGSGGIIGVASNSEKASLMIYNNRQKYDEWDFIAILGQGNPSAATPGATNPALTNPGGNNAPRPNPFGTNPTSPFGTPSTSPTSPFGPPSGSPLGNSPTGMPVQQPFGFGNPSSQQPNK